MRSARIAAIVGILTIPSLALAQGQATTMMVVSVRVVRPPAPRTEVTARTEVATVARPAPARVAAAIGAPATNTYAQPDAETPTVPAPGYQLYTINY
jgi:hypothetical protein